MQDKVNFNSIKVRLERIVGFLVPSLFGIFQFHKGTIRTIYPILDYPNIAYFNSIKVRLEQLKTAETATQQANFNSIKVRLEPRAILSRFLATYISIP